MKTNNVTKKMKLLIVALCMVMGLSFVAAPIASHAAGYDIGWLGGEGNETFNELENQVKETGNSAYRLLLAIGAVGILLSLVICGISIAVNGGGNKRAEKLGWLLWIGLGGIVVFGAVSLVGVFQNIGSQLM